MAKAAAFALAAVRETYEETGIMLGTRASGPMRVPPGPWEAFARAGIAPDDPRLAPVVEACRAIARRDEGFVGPDKELIELVWLPITEARRLDMPGITAVVLEELQDRIAAGMSHDHPVPLYRMLNKRFVREIL